MKILFVCTGNTCRSPMAEAIAKKYVDDHKLANVIVESAGIAAFEGQPAARNAVEAMKALSVDISNYKAKCMINGITKGTDYFVPMTDEQKIVLLSLGITEDKIIDFETPIPDPYGGNFEIYTACRDVLTEQINFIFKRAIKND
jgi:protein-tyrosine-phosphatase